MRYPIPLALLTLLALPACEEVTNGFPSTQPSESSELVSDLRVEISSEVGTVATVSWTTAEPTVGWVEFGLDGDLELSTNQDAAATTEHSFMLLGMLPQTEYRLEILNQTADAAVTTSASTLTTGALDTFGISPTVTGVDAARTAGGYLLAPVWGDPEVNHLAIFDSAGRHVWAHDLGNSTYTRARLSADGRSVLYNQAAFQPDEIGSVVRLSLDGSEVEVAEAMGAYMDFVEVEPGLYATLSTEMMDMGGGRVVLDETIIEFRAGAEPEVAWSAVQSLDIDLSESFPAELFGPEYEMPLHLNSLSYDAAEGAYYTTSLYREAVYKIDRASGEVEWKLARDQGDFAAQPGNDDLGFVPHSAMPTADGVLLFDRGSSSSTGCSAAAEYGLDLSEMTAQRDWQYFTDDCQHTMMLGNAQPLWNGNRLLVLAMNGQIDELSPEGELVWRFNVNFGSAVMFSERFESFYR